jgi:hypothetical protein
VVNSHEAETGVERTARSYTDKGSTGAASHPRTVVTQDALDAAFEADEHRQMATLDVHVPRGIFTNKSLVKLQFFLSGKDGFITVRHRH